MYKRIGLLLINKAHPELLAKWNHDTILNEIRNFIKENNMQDTVTLKIGDILESYHYRLGSTHTITSFCKDKINTTDGHSWKYPLMLDQYYVNGKLYTVENIIVPEFKEEEKMEHQPITKENIVDVLEYNKIDKRLYSVFSNTIILHVPMGENHYHHDLTIPFNMNCWLGVVDSIFGKLQPLPKVNPFDVVKVGQWIKNLGGCNEWRTKSKWYQRCHGSLVFGLAFRSDRYDVVFSNNPSEWDLTDIRDYNPNEYELKIGDVISFLNLGNLTITGFDYENEKIRYTSGKDWTYFCDVVVKWKDKLINGKQYNKLTIPAFDFKQTLLDNGFTRTSNSDCFDLVSKGVKCRFEVNEWFYNSHNSFKPTPKNAKLLIDMAKLAKGVEMRTIEEVLAENPNAMFSCNSVEYGAHDGSDIFDQIEYCHDDDGEKPTITYCKPNYFKMHAQRVLDLEQDGWGHAYDDWYLKCSDKLRDKLQSVLDEIVAENANYNISYSEGEELNIDEIWSQMGDKE